MWEGLFPDGGGLDKGDTESYAGFELWCYCEDCQTDTFHKMVKDENSRYDELLERFQQR